MEHKKRAGKLFGRDSSGTRRERSPRTREPNRKRATVEKKAEKTRQWMGSSGGDRAGNTFQWNAKRGRAMTDTDEGETFWRE